VRRYAAGSIFSSTSVISVDDRLAVINNQIKPANPLAAGPLTQ